MDATKMERLRNLHMLTFSASKAVTSCLTETSALPFSIFVLRFERLACAFFNSVAAASIFAVVEFTDVAPAVTVVAALVTSVVVVLKLEIEAATFEAELRM